ncbi:hypothetical protein BD769DRAFT_1681618 [Suillus cothurnatus]|nr:hypothetical protein BD769DRAFT_1681618 [Suillus cothurnatus]
MPFRGTDRAPKFNGTTDNLAEFIDAYEQLADEAGLQGLNRIKGIIRYLERDDRELWAGLPEAQESDYDVFMKEIKVMYPGWDGKRKIMQPLLNEDRIGKAERDCIFMEGIPSEAQAPIRMRLMIKHPDHYPQDPYPFMQVYAAGQFILPANAPPPTTAPSAQNAIPTLSATAPSAHTPSARAPSTCTPSARAPSARAPSAHMLSAHTPSARAPSTCAPSARAPSAHTPSTCAPSMHAPTPMQGTDHYHASRATQDMTTSASATAGLFYRASSEVVLDKRPPVPTLVPYHELEHALVKRTASASSPSSSTPSPSQSPSSSALSSPIAPLVRDDSKHLLHNNAPLKTRSPIAIAPPIVRDDSKHLLHNNAPIVDIITPSLETRPPIASLKEEILPVTPSLSLLSPLASSDVRDDPKHQLCLSAPIEEPSTASEARITPRIDQSLSLVIPSVTNDHAHVALFAPSDYRLPVKHPCITPAEHQAEHVSGDPGVTQAHHMAPDNAQCARIEALYIYPHLVSRFLSFAHLKLLRSYITIPNTFISSSHYPSFTRHDCAHCAIIHAPRAFIILAEFPHYRISIISPLLNHISVIQRKTYSNQPSRRNLGARLTHTYAPNFPIIIFNFATSTFIRVLHIFARYVNFVPAHLDVHYSLSPMRLLRLDIPPLQPICTTFAPNSTIYTSLANTFPEKWPFLACLANIIKFARNLPKARTSRASYQLVERLYTPHSASHWRAFNLQRVVQEFILPVTSLP